MDNNYPKNSDPRPKRRRSKDNPYEIYSVGANTEQPHYYIIFTDSAGVHQELEIDKSLFDTMDRFELDDLSFLNEVDNHYERSELTEASLNGRAFEPQKAVEEAITQRDENERLHKAIAMLPEKQRNRLMLYYWGDLTYEQIAEMEDCKHPAIMKSVSAAIEKLKKFLSE
ncbi:sigma-70 family RNA polymerase sigma factor [Oscillospiraceae bacterium 42-9]